MARGDRGPLNDIQIDIPATAVSFDVDAFDELIQTHGVRLVHYQATRCPVGLQELGDLQRAHDDHEGCSNGFLYTPIGIIRAFSSGNSKHKNASELGFWDGSTIQASFERFYACDCNGSDCGDKRLYVAPFDRFFLEEKNILVPTWQLFAHHQTGHDRLKYPVEQVEQLVDSRGERYQQDLDFRVVNGQLLWTGPGLSGRRPTDLTVTSDTGVICSVRYLYRPWWYVGQLVHEIRVSQVTGTDGREVSRLPQLAVLHREYVATTRDQQTPGSPDGRPNSNGVDADALRTVLGPMSGGLGPR